ncbi:MAG: response regulator transcription factor [Anaerolineales bacterium]|jgi:DNA-binding response OmpR family regulator
MNKPTKTKGNLFWIEGSGSTNPEFVPGLQQKGYKVYIFSTGKDAIASLDQEVPDLVVINAASMRSTGTRICHGLRIKVHDLPIVLISSPDKTPNKDNVQANVVLKLPFTIRKLVNRIKPLVQRVESKVIKVGDIKLDLDHLHVYCEGREAHLTPRMVQLLKMLMEKPGEVVERDKMFRKVWYTDYIDDTRTLDVHISWLRKAIEEDPRKPQYLKTIRGVGYRLDA